jgi:CRISPR-associated protein Cmr1
MRKLEYSVSFNTPAFLGNAEQQAQWRTPPFKALIRQWWRVAVARDLAYDVDALRTDEANLFGSAYDTEGSRSGRSRVAVRLSSWKRGAMEQWQTGDRVFHPEVGQGGREIGADLYLGYGPLTFVRGGTGLGTVKVTDVQRTAINPKADLSRLILGVPEEQIGVLQKTMQLIASFGTLGSRSRNGWGSVEIRAANTQDVLSPLIRASLEQWNVCRPFADCLKVDWPHAIGTDEKGPLVWRTKSQSVDWRPIIKELARIKIEFRTQFGFSSGGPHSSPTKRHVLAYPVTKHALNGWQQQARLGNQLRFKVATHQNGKLEGVIVHLPCKVPDELVNKLSQSNQQFIRDNELGVWQSVHKVLDKEATRLA